MYDLFGSFALYFGKKFNDYSEYRLTQMFDIQNNPSNTLYLSSRSLNKTTYKNISLEDLSSFNFEFVRSEMNHGIYKNKNKVIVLKYFGRAKQLVNTPYMIEVNFGDYIVFSNGLLMIVPKNKFKSLFKK